MRRRLSPTGGPGNNLILRSHVASGIVARRDDCARTA